MNKSQLNHLLQAISVMARPDSMVVLGSQAAVLHLNERAPQAAFNDMQLEVHLPNFETKGFSPGFDVHKPGERTDQAVDEVLGKVTYFHGQFGYYAETVRDWQIEFPEGWAERATKIETKGLATVIYPSLVDACAISLSRLEKEEPDHDVGWVEELVATGQVDALSLKQRIFDGDGVVWVRFAELAKTTTDPVAAERFRSFCSHLEGPDDEIDDPEP